MKKIALFALACASIFGSSNVSAQEVTYVEDCSQGLLINKMRSNWFITAQGGGNFLFGNNDSKAEVKNRFGASAAIFGGKWFTPVWGFRFGVSGNIARGATPSYGEFRDQNAAPIKEVDGVEYYPERIASLGPEIDLMLNLTNWWCGYRPGRVYNAVLHGGMGGYFTFRHSHENGEAKWEDADSKTLFANVGLQNNFAVSKHVELFLDLQGTLMQYNAQEHSLKNNRHGVMTIVPSAQIGVTYNFGGNDNWSCPVTAVCPTWKYTDAEGDALVARLANAENNINVLQRQLDDCLNRPTKDCTNVVGSALATVYYPINVATLSSREITLVEAMAKTMIANPDKKYILTGWADNYTGSSEYNARLRQQRVDGVRNCLVNAGVPASQLETRVDANNLTDYGVKGAQFDRAVTVVEAK